MARRKPLLRVVTSDKAASDLEEIYRYNAKTKSVASAERWEDFLKAKIASLARDYDEGRPIEDFPDLRRILAKRKEKGHGHYLIYEIDPAAKVVNILHVYHTRMDVEGRLREEGR